MINYHEQIVEALEKILPTHYEMVLHSGIETPCLSYMELGNVAADEGDTLGYSRLTFQIKVWGTDLGVIQEYALQVDEALRALGFKRISSGEMYDQNSAMIQKIMSFEALAKEDFKKE